MDKFFFPTNICSLRETFQLYVIAKYKASNCCKIEGVIQRCSVKKVFLKILQNSQENPLCQSLFFNKVAAQKDTLTQMFSCEYCEILKTPSSIKHLRCLPLVKLEPSLWNQQNFNSSYLWLHLISWAPSTLWQNSCKTQYPQKTNLNLKIFGLK